MSTISVVGGAARFGVDVAALVRAVGRPAVVSTVLQLAGLACLVVMAFLVGLVAGVGALGGALLLLGYALEPRQPRPAPGRSGP